MATGFLFDERCMWHDTGSSGLWHPAGDWVQPEAHVEGPEAKRRIRNLAEVSGFLGRLTSIEPRMATDEEILRVHTASHLERIQGLSRGRGGDAGDGGTPFGPGGIVAARAAAGGAIAALDAILDGSVDNAYALVRPPGHHASADSGMGFCIFNNVAVAARHAQARGIARIAIVDWDVHHGNGTQSIFYRDPSVLTISVHQDGYYPLDSGRVTENGGGAGFGNNINVPLPPGSGRDAYIAAFERIVRPALMRFQPGLIIVASGLDASIYDPMARMMVTSRTFGAIARIIKETAQICCGGKVLLSHEGGYSTAYAPFCGMAILEALSGMESGVKDPFASVVENVPGHHLQPNQDKAIADAEGLLVTVPGSGELTFDDVH